MADLKYRATSFLSRAGDGLPDCTAGVPGTIATTFGYAMPYGPEIVTGCGLSRQ